MEYKDKYFSITIVKRWNNCKLSKFLYENFENVTNISIQKFLRNKDILINNKVAKSNDRLQTNNVISISSFSLKILNKNKIVIKNKTDLHFSETEIKKIQNSVIYKDENIIGINKTKGLSVQSGTKIEKSLNDYLQFLKFEKNEIPKLVHRLDKDTTGVLLLARNKESAESLGELFKNKNDDLIKTYITIIIGKLSRKEGEITFPLIKKIQNGIEKVYRDDLDGKAAITKYKVLNYSEKYNVSLLEVQILTGRTHQIRVHLKEIGNPILGDGKYGGNRAYVDGLTKDMCLHSYSIEIRKYIKIIAPLSSFFQTALNKIGFIYENDFPKKL